ncbi:polysaccharide pyruvyl transferase family protein [Amycolatopsis aidingensis]|uniref:polysaccharide pyruvyl transferase family protein n=1 Tax=Amycolatopsis aidingensis TaxID=2842453 RepID=UPI001C0DF111|nr:polysaccharide pyruvyl transferase family protein [Amycolatopsis aidingensis]
MRVLVTGWPSFDHGEAAAGDVLGMRRVHSALTAAGIECDLSWSPGLRAGEPGLRGADPDRYTHLVFACGPLRGRQLRELHSRYARCHRIAIGVSVLDPADPAASGFHRVLPREAEQTGHPDLAIAADGLPVPVAGVTGTHPRPEYGEGRTHPGVYEALTGWLSGLDCARVPLETRLDPGDWRRCATPDQVLAVLRRLDVLVTTQAQDLVLALGQGVPVLAVDPVNGGGRLSAQACVLGWPALVSAEDTPVPGAFEDRWRWCLSAEGRQRAARHRGPRTDSLLGELMRQLETSVAA